MSFIVGQEVLSKNDSEYYKYPDFLYSTVGSESAMLCLKQNYICIEDYASQNKNMGITNKKMSYYSDSTSKICKVCLYTYV